MGLGPCSPRGAPRPAWHLPAPAQAPGSPGPARRAKVAAKTAPPLARRRRLRLGAAGRGGGAVCPCAGAAPAPAFPPGPGRGGPTEARPPAPGVFEPLSHGRARWAVFPLQPPLPRPGRTRGLDSWGPGEWMSGDFGERRGPSFSGVWARPQVYRHREALTLTLGSPGMGMGGIRVWRRACDLKEEAVGRSCSGADSIPLFSLREFSCSEREERARAAVGLFSASEKCFRCLLKRVARRGFVESGCPHHLG